VNKEKLKEFNKIIIYATIGFMGMFGIGTLVSEGDFMYASVLGIITYYYMILSQQIIILRKEVKK